MSMPAKVDVAKVLKLYFVHGLSMREIAKQLNVSKAAVHKRISEIKEMLFDKEKLDALREKRIELLETAEFKLLTDLMSPERRKKATLAQTAMAYGVITDKRRLEEGKSTQNISYADMCRISRENIERIENTLKILKEKVKELDDQERGSIEISTSNNVSMQNH